MAELAIGAHPGLSVAEETLSAHFLLATWSEGTDWGQQVPGTLLSPELSVEAPVGADSLEGLYFLFQREAPAFQCSHGLGQWPLCVDKLDIGHS